MSRWIGVDEEDIEKAVKLVGGGRAFHLLIYRALPIMPLSLVSLATGALRRGAREFTIYTFAGCLPRYIFLGYLGWVMQDLYMEMADLLDSLETATIVLIEEAPEEVRPMEKPSPIVYKPGTGGLRTRKGRGFSLGELREAGLDPNTARKLGIYVDRRRKSIHKENVEALKKYLEELRKQ